MHPLDSVANRPIVLTLDGVWSYQAYEVVVESTKLAHFQSPEYVTGVSRVPFARRCGMFDAVRLHL
jgi:hypothetical protein